jgi:hypothetical protein
MAPTIIAAPSAQAQRFTQVPAIARNIMMSSLMPPCARRSIKASQTVGRNERIARLTVRATDGDRK